MKRFADEDRRIKIKKARRARRRADVQCIVGALARMRPWLREEALLTAATRVWSHSDGFVAPEALNPLASIHMEPARRRRPPIRRLVGTNTRTYEVNPY